MFDKPIPLRRRDELGDLALCINTMAQRIEGMLDNALRYSADAAQLSVITLTQKPGGLQLERLIEPFYRTDSARQRVTGGVGRGMYLCQLVAEAHGAQLVLRNAKPGLRVSMLLN